MSAPKRVRDFVFIMVPKSDSDYNGKLALRASQMACRVAHLMGLTPISPLLFYLSYLTEGELSIDLATFSKKWVRRCGKIWLQFPVEDDVQLDALSFGILDDNYAVADYRERLPVYQLEHTGDQLIGFMPVPMQQKEIDELLNLNLTKGLASKCL